MRDRPWRPKYARYGWRRSFPGMGRGHRGSGLEKGSTTMSDNPQGTARSVLHLVRVTIEVVSPLSLGSGDTVRIEWPLPGGDETGKDRVPEIALVRDANELPTVPGSTLKGVLRRIFR